MGNHFEHKNSIIQYAKENYNKMFREPEGFLKYKYIVPGSTYSDCLWDWDSWLTNIALRKIGKDEELKEYEKGCILNFLDNIDEKGRMPIYITPYKKYPDFSNDDFQNVHKPCLVQHALFVCEQNNDYSWLKNHYLKIKAYLNFYMNNCKHEIGLFYWLNDNAIGVDNDPCTFYRPNCSSASVYLNCMMYSELKAMAIIAQKLQMSDDSIFFQEQAETLKIAVRTHMWDERNGFYYSVDLNLIPVDLQKRLHSGQPRNWKCIIQKIDVWSGFMAMWAGIATKEQADRMVNENYCNSRIFNAPFGVRTLSTMEKMYQVVKSSNPSCWLGPIWGVANYMTFVGLLNYGYTQEARELELKTVKLFGEDIIKNGEMHEYYDPETGEGVNNPGFQNWNLLVLNMMDEIDKLDELE